MIQDDEELVFLYNLADSHANSSYAGHIARLAGIPDTLVKRGAEVTRAAGKTAENSLSITGNLSTFLLFRNQN